MNPTMLEALGYSMDEVVGENYQNLFIPVSERDLLGMFSMNWRFQTMQQLAVIMF